MEINYLALIEKLVKDKVCTIYDGVELHCNGEVSFSLHYDRGLVIKFDSENKIVVKKIGSYRFINWFSPTLNSITITPTSYKIDIENLPDIEVSRDNSSSKG
jgi:hypothetical protein